MDTYTAMRQFADSWALLAMVLFFLGVVIRAFAPGAQRAAQMRNAAAIPMDERSPAEFARDQAATAATPAEGDQHVH